MSYPVKIRIPSDNTELEFISSEVNPKTKEVNVSYKYIVAKHHLGSIIKWSDKEFQRVLRNGIVVAIF